MSGRASRIFGWALLALAVICVLATAACWLMAVWGGGHLRDEWIGTAFMCVILAVISGGVGMGLVTS